MVHFGFGVSMQCNIAYKSELLGIHQALLESQTTPHATRFWFPCWRLERTFFHGAGVDFHKTRPTLLMFEVLETATINNRMLSWNTSLARSTEDWSRLTSFLAFELYVDITKMD